MHPIGLPLEMREWIDRLQGSNQLSTFKGTGGLSGQVQDDLSNHCAASSLADEKHPRCLPGLLIKSHLSRFSSSDHHVKSTTCPQPSPHGSTSSKYRKSPYWRASAQSVRHILRHTWLGWTPLL